MDQVELEEISEDDIVKPASTLEIGESSGSSGSSDISGDSGSTDDTKKKALQNKWCFRSRMRLIARKDGRQASKDLHLEQLDVKTVSPHGDLKEDIYMVQPEGYQVARKENLVCKLKSVWVETSTEAMVDSFMQRNGYTRCEMDHCCYLKKFKSFYIILLLYVDDMLIAGSIMHEINRLKKQLSQKIEMKDLGAAKQILGMRIIRDRTEVGNLMYAMVCTGPTIAHAVGVVSRFMSNPGKEHWEAVKWLLLYLKDSGKSTTSYVFTIGGTTISWMSRLQKSVALSTTEAKYMAISKAAKELIWLKNFLLELGMQQEDCVLYCDNQSAVFLAKNLNPADMFTKVVTTEKLKLCMASTGRSSRNGEIDRLRNVVIKSPSGRLLSEKWRIENESVEWRIENKLVANKLIHVY
ncbi:retrovirus-related pol polyprotein from transposon TNT 1-94 [Tanacetum coccineum]